MKVFISYSATDTEFVRQIAESIQEKGMEVYWWAERHELGEEVWKQIFGWIDQADVVLAIVTGNAVKRAMAVGNEVGYAKAKGKTIIPLVTNEERPFDLGCLNSLTYKMIDVAAPQAGIQAIAAYLERKKQEKADTQNREFWGNLTLLVGVVGLVWAAAKK